VAHRFEEEHDESLQDNIGELEGEDAEPERREDVEELPVTRIFLRRCKVIVNGESDRLGEVAEDGHGGRELRVERVWLRGMCLRDDDR
jgi:hypothetical protein